MTKTRTLAALGAALLVAGCSSGGSAPTTSLRVEVFYLNLQDADYGVADVALGLEGSPDEVFGAERVAWFAPDDNGTVVFPCDPALNPYEVRVTPVGPYAELPEVLGAFGEAAPEGWSEFQNPGELTRTVECVADEETPVQFDVALMRPAQQGMMEVAINVVGEPGDAVWDLSVVSGGAPSKPVWDQRIASSHYGNGLGSASYTGPCDSAPGYEDNLFTVALVGLFADEVTGPGTYGAEAPPNALEIWPPPTVPQIFHCITDVDGWASLYITVAQRELDDARPRARLGDVTCDVTWSCGRDEEGPTLVINCVRDDGAPPTLYIDDLVVRCDGEEVERVAPSADDVVVVVEDSAHRATQWAFSPAPSAALSDRRCSLEGAATADLPSPQPPPDPSWVSASVGRMVHPRFVWSIPMRDAADCQPAALDVDGPITVTYTNDDHVSGTHYDHVFAPAGAQQETP